MPTVRVCSPRSGWRGIFLAPACGVVPLVLVTLGISYARIGNLTAPEPYRPLTSGMAIIFIGLGFRHVYFRHKPVCAEAAYCARPKSPRIVKTALWAATLLVILSVTVTWWAPLFH